MNLLISGGLGYIGSHTVVRLIENGHTVVIVDNLINSKIEVLNRLEMITKYKLDFYQVDVTDEKMTEEIFKKHKIEGVIHFAGLKSVGESVVNPIEYYRNNIMSTLVLANLCIKYGVNKFVFSSSATVYGNQKSPLQEEMELLETTNPYGETKKVNERILKDISNSNPNFNVTLLRYFNPIGAHPSGLIGENPNGTPNNLMPYITRVAKGILPKLYIFGDDYDTIDGTGVRDYIHVLDLADGHVKAIENNSVGVNIYNLGTGRGTSVLELVKAFEKVNDIKINYEITSRRPGDLAIAYADPSKANKELNWYSKYTIEDMVRDAWNFEKNND